MSIPRLPRPVHVLVVDDDPTNRLVASKLCELYGATCETTDCGEDAVVLCATGAFDIVLMDIRMPLMDGIETSYAIRSLPGPAGMVPIIAVTGDDDSGLRQLCHAAGMSTLIPKPIVIRRLYEAMEAAIAAGGVAAADQTEKRGAN